MDRRWPRVYRRSNVGLVSLWVCPCHKSPLIEVRISKFWPKMHLSIVKVSIDFGIDWPWSSVLFSISNQLFFSKLCVSHSFASFCIYLVRPSSVSVPHATWHRTYTDSHECGQGPTMDRETVPLYLGEIIGVSASLDSAIGTGFYKLLSVFAILYMLRMSKFYMPTLINHQKNSKTVPISLYFVQVSSWGSCLSAIFSVVNTYAVLRIPVCSTS